MPGGVAGEQLTAAPYADQLGDGGQEQQEQEPDLSAAIGFADKSRYGLANGEGFGEVATLATETSRENGARTPLRGNHRRLPDPWRESVGQFELHTLAVVGD